MGAAVVVWRFIQVVTLLAMSNAEPTTPTRPVRSGGASSMDLSPMVIALPVVPSRAARTTGSSGFKACQCKLTVMIDGEQVKTCAGYGLQHAQRSVNLSGRLTEQDLLKALYGPLGYDKTDKWDSAEAVAIAAALSKGGKDSTNYKFNMHHFPISQLKLTNQTVRMRASGVVEVWPTVTASVVYARTQLAIDGAAPGDSLTYVPPEELPTRPDVASVRPVHSQHCRKALLLLGAAPGRGLPLRVTVVLSGCMRASALFIYLFRARIGTIRNIKLLN
jgi:hypothetical protein